MPKLLLRIFLLLALAACSNKGTESPTQSKEYVSAMQKLNAHDYEGASSELETLAIANPQNVEIKKKLMHAYAGASGFEALRFKNMLERLASGKPRETVAKALEEFKRIHGLHSIKSEDVRRFYAQRLSGGLVKALEDVPQLSQRQYSRLNQAIGVYEELGFDPRTSSRDDNFQWGLLYSYRILVNVRALFTELDHVALGKETRDNRELERRFIRSVKLITADVLKAYKLFRNSYEKLQAVSGKVEEFFAQISGQRLKARVLNTANTAEEMLEGFFDDNKAELAGVFGQMVARARNNDFEGELRRAFGEFENQSPEVRYHKNRIRAVARVFGEQFRADHAEAEGSLRELFTDQLRAEMREALKDSLAHENLDPLHALYRDERSTFHRAADIAKALADDVNVNTLREEIKPHVQALLDRVDRTQLEMFRDDLRALLGDEREIVETELARHKADGEYLKKMLGGRVHDLEQILREEVTDPARPIGQELARPDPDAARENHQVRQTENFLNR